MDPDAGGEAPSVDEKARMATTATTGSTPTEIKAENETSPTAVNVAVEDRGPATSVTRTPTMSTMSHFGMVSTDVICVKSSASPNSAST